MRPVEKRPDRHGKSASAIATLPARHIPVTTGVATDTEAAAVWANRLSMPADLFEIFDGLVLSLEILKEFNDIHGPAPDSGLNL